LEYLLKHDNFGDKRTAKRDSDMSKKIALVTGGATGIGAAVCTELANHDIHVAICDINQTDGNALAKKISGEFIKCDVTSLASVEEAVKVCTEKLGVPDYVHLNAGIMTVPTGDPFLAIEDVTEAQYQKIVGVNLNGVFHGMKILLPLMRKKGGTVTITASTAGLSVVPVDPMYTATKYALIGFGRAVAAANETSNIRINVICPGVTNTQIVPDEYRVPEFNVMHVKVMATEIVDLLFNGSNGEIRVKNGTEIPAFSVGLPVIS
jgi:NAD(P)-dependent dehydrogenase (short-subunit alcohol dehydrogenase family)